VYNISYLPLRKKSERWILLLLLLLLLLLTFNVTGTQSIKDHTLVTALRQCWTVSQWSNSSTYLNNKHDHWRNQAFSRQPSHTRSTSFYLSPYSLSPQPVIPCAPISSHSYIFVRCARIFIYDISLSKKKGNLWVNKILSWFSDRISIKYKPLLHRWVIF